MSRREEMLRRRRKVMYQRAAVIAVTICMVVCGVLVGSSISASGRSKASDDQVSFKYYTSIEIEQGDSLWTIACEHMSHEYASVQDYIDEVKVLNNLKSDDIHSGQYLTIPYYSSEFH